MEPAIPRIRGQDLLSEADPTREGLWFVTDSRAGEAQANREAGRVDSSDPFWAAPFLRGDSLRGWATVFSHESFCHDFNLADGAVIDPDIYF